MNLSADLIEDVLKHPERQYKRVLLKKRFKGYRVLHCPTRLLKAVQSWILRAILEKVPLHDAATAFRKGTGLLENVLPHKNNHYFLCLDLNGFFDAITFPRVIGIFRALGYSIEAADMLATLCTVRGRLPQGGVTSPYLSNIACVRLDRRINKFTENRHVTYTRYADDITLSARSPSALFSCVALIRKIIAEEGFILNNDKTRVAFPQDRRVVTGLVVSRRRISVGRRQLHRLRACIHQLHSGTATGDKAVRLFRHVNGWMSYLHDVDKTGFHQLRKYSKRLKSRASATLVAAAKHASP